MRAVLCDECPSGPVWEEGRMAVVNKEVTDEIERGSPSGLSPIPTSRGRCSERARPLV